MNRLISYIFFLILSPLAILRADEYPSLLREAYNSILAIDGEKVYLDPTKITVTDEGLFLRKAEKKEKNKDHWFWGLWSCAE